MGSCFLPPFPTSCSGIPFGCGSCVKECSHGNRYSPSPPPTPPSGESCKVTCKGHSCEVRTGYTMGSCFLPPFPTRCQGIPSGCGSCVNKCS